METSEPEDLDIPSGAFEFLLGMTGKAPVPKQAHDTAEELLSLLQRRVQRDRQKIRALEKKVEEIEAEFEGTSEEQSES